MLGLFNRILYLFTPIALFVAATPVHAGLVTYADLTSWTAASNGVSTIDFEGLVVSNHFRDYSTSTGLLIDGVGFNGYLSASPSWELQVVDGTQSFYNFGSGASLKGPSYNAPPAGFQPYVHVTLPSNVSAFAVDLMTVSPNALTFRITLPGGNTFTTNTANIPERTFWGITSDTPIASVDLTVLGTTNGQGTYGLADNVRFGTAAPAEAAELCTMLLIGTGLLALIVLRKIRLRQRTVTV